MPLRALKSEMASFCRKAIMAGSRSLAARSKTLTQNGVNAKPISSAFSSSPTRSIISASRVVSVLGSVESLMPLHTATANARLKSNIAVDSSCWSWLSQGSKDLKSEEGKFVKNDIILDLKASQSEL